MDSELDTLWQQFAESLAEKQPKITPDAVETYKSIFYAGAWAAAWQFPRHTNYSDEWVEAFRAGITQTLDACAKPVMEELIQ